MSKRLLITIAILALAACDKGVTGISTVTGQWTLRTVNGAALPYTMTSSGANKTELIDDTIILYEGFTFAQTVHTRVTVNGQVSTVTTSESGAYALFGTSVTLTGNSGALARRGLIDGNTMTIVENGLVSAYKK
jgi:hypothetical protein